MIEILIITLSYFGHSKVKKNRNIDVKLKYYDFGLIFFLHI